MAGEEEERTLPDHLLEKIVAMLPFPSIFKARCLSKSWLARFSPISAQPDDSMKFLAASFQKQVSELSSNWRTFCPVYVDEDVFTAYDRVSGKWLKLPSLSYLPKEFLSESALQIEGPLLYGFSREVGGFASDICVANVLTGRWKQLPSRPQEGESVVFKLKLVIGADVETYKVILVCHDRLLSTRPDFHKIYIQIYDSDSAAWTHKAFIVPVDLLRYFIRETTDAFLNGVLYISKIYNWVKFVAIDIIEGTVKEIELLDIDIWKFHSASVVVCQSSLFMVVDRGPYRGNALSLQKIDLSSQSLSEVAQFVDMSQLYFGPVSDGDRIYILRERSHVLDSFEYDLHERQFTFRSIVPPNTAEYERRRQRNSIYHRKSMYQPGLTPFIDRYRQRWMRSSFQPGFSPFVAV